MKNIILIFLFAFFIKQANSQCCRYINIKIKVIEPSIKTIVYSPGKLYYKIRIYNPGFDTIRPIDSFIYYINRSKNFGSDIYESFKYRFTRAVPKGDSIDIIGNFNITDSIDNPQYTLSTSGIIRNRKTFDIIPETTQERSDNSSDVTFKQIYDPNHTALSIIFKNKLNIFPNPANTLFNISIPPEIINQTSNIKIFDMHGQQIHSYLLSNFSSNFQIPIEDFANGNYLILLESSNLHYQSILSVQH